MADISIPAGSDGFVPIRDPSSRWMQWALFEIFMGIGTPGAQDPAGTKERYIPKVNDWVIDPDTAERWSVVSIDPSTLKPELRVVKDAPVDEFSEDDLLLGMGPGTQSDTYRIYVNDKVNPHTLTVDGRLKVNGKSAASCIIFRGSLIDGSAHVVSKVYDQAQNLVGQAIPLELVKMAEGLNRAVYCVPPAHCTEKMPDGEVVTAVLYSDTGIVLHKRQLLVENTAFIRTSDSATKYVTSIGIESPWVTPADPFTLRMPLNVPLDSGNFIGVVNFSDGSTKRLPVDGTKFRFDGLRPWISGLIGQKQRLVLQYMLSPDEMTVEGVVNQQGFVAQEFAAITTKAEGSYTVKLFAYPEWIDSVNGYKLRWWLLNLDRDMRYDVTPYVRIQPNSAAFNPKAYGINQRLAVTVNLQDVNGSFKNWNYPQLIDVALMAMGTERDTTRWQIGFQVGQNPPYGVDLRAVTSFINQNLMRVKIDQGEASLEDWLQRIYYRTLPVTDPAKESIPPAPNYFRIISGAWESEYFPISQWSEELVINRAIADSGTLYVQFIKRTPETDLVLSIAGLPVQQIT